MNSETGERTLLFKSMKWTTGLLFALLMAGFAARVISSEDPASIKWLSIVVFALLMFAYLAFSDARLSDFVRNRFASSPICRMGPPFILWGIYLLYTKCIIDTSAAEDAAILAYLLLPVFFLSLDEYLRKGGEVRGSLAVTAAVLSLWWPIEFDWIGGPDLPPGDGIPLVLLLGTIGALYAFSAVSGLKGIGYRFDWNASDGKWAASCFAFFTAFFAIPLGISLGFVTPAEKIAAAWSWPVLLLTIYFFRALPEEILFRGIILNLMRKTWAREQVVLLASALIFGLAHANNPNPPLVSLPIVGYGAVEVAWAYVILATIAGWFYGLAYLKTEKVSVSALVHALVNSWWALFFS